MIPMSQVLLGLPKTRIEGLGFYKTPVFHLVFKMNDSEHVHFTEIQYI